MLKEEIEIYFNELRKNVNNLIDNIYKKMLKRSADIWNFNEDVINEYNKVSSKTEIKNLFED